MVGMYMRNKNCVYIRQSQTLITQRKLYCIAGVYKFNAASR